MVKRSKGSRKGTHVSHQGTGVSQKKANHSSAAKGKKSARRAMPKSAQSKAHGKSRHSAHHAARRPAHADAVVSAPHASPAGQSVHHPPFEEMFAGPSVPDEHVVDSHQTHSAIDEESSLRTLRSLGASCYSPLGQTRWFWSKIPPFAAEHPWLRFHFLQASMLWWTFWLIYTLLLAAFALGWLFGEDWIQLRWLLFVLLVVVALHALLFAMMGSKASKGKAFSLPIIGPHATKLALSDKPLHKYSV